MKIPNVSSDKGGWIQRARHAQRVKEDPEYMKRWRVSNALAKDKARAAAGGRPPVTLPRLAFLEKPEID